MGFRGILLPKEGSAGPNSVLIRPVPFEDAEGWRKGSNESFSAVATVELLSSGNTQCYSVDVWCEGAQTLVILGLSNQRNQKLFSLSNHRLNNASSGFRSILLPTGGSAGPNSVLIRPVPFEASELKLAFTANPTTALIITSALDKDPEDHRLQPSRQRNACYHDDEHSGPQLRPQGSLPINLDTVCSKLEVLLI